MPDDITALRIKVLSDDVDIAKRRLDDLTNTSNRSENSIKNLGSNMAASMRNFAAGAITVGALTAVVGVNVKRWQEYDESMKEVSSIMATSRGEFQNLREDVLKLSVAIGVDATVAAKGLYQAISAGIPKENGLAFLETAAKVAIAGVTDTETAVDVLTNVINAYKLPVSDANVISEKLFNTVVVGKTTMEELSASMSKGTVAAASLGIPLEDLLAAVAAITLQGTSTAEAFTQISSTITALLNPSDEMGATMKKIGFESSRAAIEQLGFAETLNRVRETIGNNDAELVKATRQVEAFRGVISLTGNNLDLHKKALSEIGKESGNFAKAYVTNANTLETAQNQLSSSFTLLVENFESEFGTLEQTGNLLKRIANEIAGINNSGSISESVRVGGTQGVAILQNRLAELEAQKTQFEGEEATARSIRNSIPIIGKFGDAKESDDLVKVRQEITQITKELEKQDDATLKAAAALRTFDEARKTGNASAITTAQAQYNATIEQAQAQEANKKRLLDILDEQDKIQTKIEADKEAANAKIRAQEEERISRMKEASDDALKYGADEMQLLESKIAIQQELISISKDPTEIEAAKKYIELLEQQRVALEEKLVLEGGGVLPPKGSITGASGVPGLSGMEEIYRAESEIETETFRRRQDDMIADLTKAEDAKAKVIVDHARKTSEEIGQIEDLRNSKTFDGVQFALDSIANIQGEFGEKGFKIAQAAAIASATMSMYQSANAAFATGSAIPGIGAVAGPAFAAAAIAAGAANIASIKSQSYAGAFEKGGMIPSGSFGLVGEAGPEFVSGPAYVTSAKATANKLSEKSNGQGSILNVILQNLPGQTADVSTSEDGKTITLAVKQAMAQLTKEAMQGGGTVFPAFMQSTGIKRR
ncbi:MAG: phage tail tape measure protein [Bombella sp.]|nr:phage tail tape measure protein [Bombella sp.]